MPDTPNPIADTHRRKALLVCINMFPLCLYMSAGEHHHFEQGDSITSYVVNLINFKGCVEKNKEENGFKHRASGLCVLPGCFCYLVMKMSCFHCVASYDTGKYLQGVMGPEGSKQYFPHFPFAML